MPVLLCLVSPNVKYPIAIAAILWIFVAVNPITFSIGSLQQKHVQNMAEISDIALEEHLLILRTHSCNQREIARPVPTKEFQQLSTAFHLTGQK